LLLAFLFIQQRQLLWLARYIGNFFRYAHVQTIFDSTVDSIVIQTIILF